MSINYHATRVAKSKNVKLSSIVVPKGLEPFATAAQLAKMQQELQSDPKKHLISSLYENDDGKWELAFCASELHWLIAARRAGITHLTLTVLFLKA